MSGDAPFWKSKTPEEMSRTEWESLCDGCGLCCLNKLENEDTGEVVFTSVACRWLDLGACRCSDYPNRLANAADCISLTPARVRELHWLPESCGYRLVLGGEDLPWWHPLVSGDPESVHRAGVSVRGRAVPEAYAGDLEDFIVDWAGPGGPPRPAKRRRGGAD